MSGARKNVRKLFPGEKVMCASGIVFLLSLFVPWWQGIPGNGNLLVRDEIPVSATGLEETWNAFEGSTFGEVFWVATALGCVAVLAIALTRTDINSPIALCAVVALLSVVSLIFLVLQIIDPPELMNRDWGLFVGLLSLVGVVVGAGMILTDEGTGRQ